MAAAVKKQLVVKPVVDVKSIPAVAATTVAPQRAAARQNAAGHYWTCLSRINATMVAQTSAATLTPVADAKSLIPVVDATTVAIRSAAPKSAAVDPGWTCSSEAARAVEPTSAAMSTPVADAKSLIPVAGVTMVAPRRAVARRS